MKSIFKIHILYYLLALICLLTGVFKDFILMSTLIIIHELGHITGGIYYKWKIEKVIILPFGGMTIFNELLNRPWNEEFVILILGPIYQVIFFYIITLLNMKTDIINYYHYSLLIFNFLPIIPLDGSKLIKLILEKVVSYKMSFEITLIISFILFIVLLFYSVIKVNLVMFIIVIFLLKNIITEYNNRNHHFNRFLLERYLNNFNFRKNKNILGDELTKMKRDYRHFFFIKNKWYTEKETLKKMFDIKRNLW